MADESNQKLFSAPHVGDMTRHVSAFVHFATEQELDASHPRGIYYMGIIACACRFESILEDVVVAWCSSRTGEEGFNQRVLEKVKADVSRATGLEAWKSWLKILFDINLPKVLEPEWKSLVVLFKLRNQMAHGRTTKFMSFYREDGKFLGMSLAESSYKEPFEHLLQANVISVPDGTIPSAETFLTKRVIQYFADCVDRAVGRLQQCSDLATIQFYRATQEEFVTGSEVSAPSDLDLVAEVHIGP